MNLYSLEAPSLPAPTPKNKELEILTIQQIRDACYLPQFSPESFDFSQFGELTSWVSLQLSLLSIAEAEDGQEQVATKLGIASLEVARMVGDYPQYFGNILDQSKVLLRFGRLDETSEVLYHIVNSLHPGADHARPGAHISLAGIYRLRSQTDNDPALVENALYHFERGLRYFNSAAAKQQFQPLLAQFAPLYKKVNDLAGLTHCAAQLGQMNLVTTALQEISTWKSLDRMIFVTSRFRALEEHELADKVLDSWRASANSASPNPQPANPTNGETQ